MEGVLEKQGMQVEETREKSECEQSRIREVQGKKVSYSWEESEDIRGIVQIGMYCGLGRLMLNTKKGKKVSLYLIKLTFFP